MKFLLLDVQDTSKSNIRKIELNEKHYINEITFSKSVLDKLACEPKTILEKIKYKFYDKHVERIIIKMLEKHDTKWQYILSKDLMGSNKYLNNKLEQLLGYKAPSINEMESNIFKHINEYLDNNSQSKSHELKVLLVVTSNKNLNVNLLSNLIKEYKCVNIYLNEQPSEYILKKIKQINKSEGTTIEILKKERRSFIEYNVIYFVDDFMYNYPRLRFNKNAKTIDLEEARQDKYNSSIIYLNEYINKQNTYSENIQHLKKKYSYLELAQVIKKITNVLDKM